jgi:tetrapyrrole methylase family protein/MazG family protein
VQLPNIAELLKKTRYGTQDLQDIVAILRAPGGCPWDAAQTHASIRQNFIEETYEVVEAINQSDDTMLCEELGDVLLQVALHTQMSIERGAFGWEDVTDGICRKLIERHPHVFGMVEVNGVGEVLRNWDAIKRKSKGQKTTIDAMEHVPRELPALMRACKIKSKAQKAGFDWTSLEGVLGHLESEIAELRKAIASGDDAHAQEVLGDMLFAAANAARFMPQNCDAEILLNEATDKFTRRFAHLETLAAAEGVDLRTCDSAVQNRLWETAKAIASANG